MSPSYCFGRFVCDIDLVYNCYDLLSYLLIANDSDYYLYLEMLLILEKYFLSKQTHTHTHTE